ncbi:GNAT family N-acetyltransferase [Chitinivorax sp. PXF-14]|uniref:GNAT family N-acetyltransferase n=1 Tax=Chitinivorax sp. PXF-14 TaxID=3230488 RepID=UPI00346794AD
MELTVVACEAVYRDWGLRPLFKLAEQVAPPQLDPLLAARGYRVLDPTLVQVAALPAEFGLSTEVAAMPALDEDWLRARQRLMGESDVELGIVRDMLSRLPVASSGFALSEAGQVVAIGLAVIQHGWVGLFDVVTDPALRRRGLGRRVVAAMLGWAAQRGAHHGYLQVVVANAPAVALYRSFGFDTHYRYWYRAAADGSETA